MSKLIEVNETMTALPRKIVYMTKVYELREDLRPDSDTVLVDKIISGKDALIECLRLEVESVKRRASLLVGDLENKIKKLEE